jgi:RNA polymerase sigma-70 factor (ECF subfamily)
MTDHDREQRFEGLVQSHADAVHLYLRRRHPGGDANDAEDLLSEALAVAWRRLDDIPADATLPWLYGVARKQLANARRRSERRSSVQVLLPPHGPEASAEDEVVASLSVQAAINGLTPGEREALLLTAWEGLTPTELSVALGVSVNAAGVRLSKARAHFRRNLEALKVSSPSEPTSTSM